MSKETSEISKKTMDHALQVTHVIDGGDHHVIGDTVSLGLVVIFCKRDTSYRALLRKMTYGDKERPSPLHRWIGGGGTLSPVTW